MDIAPVAASLPPAKTQADTETDVAKSFETLFLTQFVDEMLKTVDPSAFGGEDNAHMWRSFMSEAVAKHLAESGDFGFETSIGQALNAYDQTARRVP